MKNKKIYLLLISILVILSAVGIAQNLKNNTVSQKQNSNSTQNPSGLNLRFLDEATGYAVVPEKVEIKQRENNKVNYEVLKRDIDLTGSVKVKLPNGVYDLTVYATGYKPMTTDFNLSNQMLTVNFNLKPLIPLEELSSKYIISLLQPNVTVIVGFVVDDFTGKPLDKVAISTLDKTVESATDAKGYFQIILPLPENKQITENRGTILFEKNNYTTEIRQNFDIVPMGAEIWQIRMKKGIGINKEDILKRKARSIILGK